MKVTGIAAVCLSASALALAGCGTDEEVDEIAAEDVEPMTGPTDDEGYPVAGELSPEQQSRIAEMNSQEVSDEYDTNYETMRSEMDAMANSVSDGAMSGSGDGSGEGMAGPTMTMPNRTAMDFSFLDRNGDGQLSVAEYAIWAVPANPISPAPNDETRPYLTSDQINEAGQTFFYFDDDGSTYLSQEEFQTARNSARTP